MSQRSNVVKLLEAARRVLEAVEGCALFSLRYCHDELCAGGRTLSLGGREGAGGCAQHAGGSEWYATDAMGTGALFCMLFYILEAVESEL